MNDYTKLDELEDLPLSKTKKKEHVEALQDLGVELINTSTEKLAKLDLPSNLMDALKEAKRLKANGAVRRQAQYIGKLMRSLDGEEIRSKLEYINGDSVKATHTFHLAEKWRDQLLSSDDSLNMFIESYSGFDIGELRSLVRLVRKEREFHQNRNFTKLFRLIRTIIEGFN